MAIILRFLDQSYSQKKADIHIAERHDGGAEDPAEEEHERTSDFLGKPRNWIDAFGRNFFPSRHSHRDQPGEAREILPWLRLSADLDPHQVQTYTVAAYWLISNMGKVDEAESFLREGLRANPDSYEILFDLGKLYDENRHDPVRARNIWELAIRRWNEQEQVGEDPDEVMYDAILAHLAHLEETKGNLREALDYLDMELDYTPVCLKPVQKHIDEIEGATGRGKEVRLTHPRRGFAWAN